jgi:hypothetical protein
MREIYIILGWIGWLWLPCALLFAIGYLKGERDATRRAIMLDDAIADSARAASATPSSTMNKNDANPDPALK